MAHVTHEDVMAIFESIPEAKQENNSLRVQLAIAMLKKRLALKLTQEDLVQLIAKNGGTITQATISKMECGESDAKISSYEKVFEVLDLSADVVSIRKRQVAGRRASRPAVNKAAVSARKAMRRKFIFDPENESTPPGVIDSKLNRIGRAAAQVARTRNVRVKREPLTSEEVAEILQPYNVKK